MSYETASSSSHRSIPPPTLPPFLHLTQENNDSNRLGASKLTMKNFRRAFHHIVPSRWFGTVARLERVAEVRVEGENVVCSSKSSNSLKHRTRGRPTSRPSTTPIISQSTALHISAPQHSPRALVASFPLPNIAYREHEEDDPALALWNTERLHRARLVKLTRHLGEEIPAEMVPSPTFLSRGTSHSSVQSYHGGHRHKCRSLDPSAFMQESSVTGGSKSVLRRSKSLKGQGDTHPTLFAIRTTSKTLSPEYIANKAHGVAMTNMVAIPNLTPPPSATPETHSNPGVNILDDDALCEEASMDTHFDTLLSHSRPFVETSKETSPFSLLASRVPPKSRALPQRPVTADASRRVEKLANFFGVGHEDVSAVVRETAQMFQFSSTRVAGDIHVPDSLPKVEVKVNKPARFWNGKAMTESAHPDDVMDTLRMMRASWHD